MIKPYIMSLTQVKTYLNILDTSYDTQINMNLPIVTDDLTRKNGICNKSFLFDGLADMDGTTVLKNVNLSSFIWACLYEDAIIRINDEDHVISSYNEDAETITLLTATTATATEEELYIRNFPTGEKPIVAQMILYKINETGVDNASFGREATSKSVGGMSISYGGGSNGSMNGYGYPSGLIRSLATVRKPRFY